MKPIRVCLLDTTVADTCGSMHRYREQVSRALASYCSQEVRLDVRFLGCERAAFDACHPRLRMFRQHAHVWHRARKLDSSESDVFHVLDGSYGYVVNAVDQARAVCTVHDVIPRLQMVGAFPTAPKQGFPAKWLIRRALRGVANSAMAVSVSHSTAQDLHGLGIQGRKGVRVVHNAVEPEQFTRSAINVDADLEPPFLFHIGNNGFYKNRLGAIKILKKLEHIQDLQLVLAGPPLDDALKNALVEMRVVDRVHVIENPSDTDVAALYQKASVLVFPSLYEGFGWPPLEAMSSGCPVVTSDAGSLPEVVGEGGVVTASEDYAAMADACERFLVDTNFRKQMTARAMEIANGFSLRQLAQGLVAIYREVARHADRSDALGADSTLSRTSVEEIGA